jgi:uncharacterized membrane protein YidH (DUF202 family)
VSTLSWALTMALGCLVFCLLALLCCVLGVMVERYTFSHFLPRAFQDTAHVLLVPAVICLVVAACLFGAHWI